MRDIYVDSNDIKNFICKCQRKDGVKTKRIFGITTSYVHPTNYRSFAYILNYLKPFLNESVDDLIKVYEAKSKEKCLSATQFAKDCKIMEGFLDKINPADLPPFSEKIATLQKQTLDFAKELIADVEKNTSVQMWYGGGTLLGAVRHKGFIPWDDDIDFDMMRPDFEELKKYFYKKYRVIDTLNWKTGSFSKEIKGIMQKYPNEIIVLPLFDVLKLVRGTEEEFISVDFFAWDYYNDVHNVDTLQKYVEGVLNRLMKVKFNSERFKIYREEIDKNENIVKDSDTIAPGIDNHAFHEYKFKNIVRKSDIFPLKKMKFEDWEFNAPNNPDAYLKLLYNYYNKIPVMGLRIACHANTKDKDMN